MNLLQRSLPKQTEEQRRIAALEQQVGFIQAAWNQSDGFRSSDISPTHSKTNELSPPQILLSAKDFENERIYRQSMQHQLHKVLKELRMARDQISKLESAVSVAAAQTGAFVGNNKGGLFSS